MRGVSLSIGKGETLGIVGESGSGKSVTSQAAMGLVHRPGRIVGGNIRWKGRTLLGSDGAAYATSIRGRAMSMIFQDSMTSLDAIFTCGTQIIEVLERHTTMGPARRHWSGHARSSISSASMRRKCGLISIPSSSRAGCANAS